MHDLPGIIGDWDPAQEDLPACPRSADRSDPGGIFFQPFLQARLIIILNSLLSGKCIASLLLGLTCAVGIYRRHRNKYGPLGKRPSFLNSILFSILALSPAGWFIGLFYWRTQNLLAPIMVRHGLDAVAGTAEFIRG